MPFTACLISATVKLETPMCRVSPKRLACASAPSVFDSGTRGLGQCSNRSSTGMRSLTRLSLVEGSRSFGGGPHLRGHEHIVAPDAGSAQAIADLAFVLINLGGVDMAIA